MASDIQAIFGNQSPVKPEPIQFRGRTLTPIKAFSQKEKLAFVDWLKSRAKRELALDREILGKEEFERRRTELQEEFDAGKYGYYSRISIAAQKTSDGMIKLLSLVFQTTEDEAFFLLAESPEALKRFNQIMTDSFPRARSSQDDGGNGDEATSGEEEVAAPASDDGARPAEKNV